MRITPREQLVLEGLADGLMAKEIAHQMGISRNTVKQFVRSLMLKTDRHTCAGLVGWWKDRPQDRPHG